MKVLFVCFGNAHRSPLAEALLKKMRPDLEVDSAGIYPSIPISEEVRKYLTKEDAVQYLKKAPEALESKQLEEYNLIVVMESRHKNAILSKCPRCNSKIVVWNIEDPYSLPPEYSEKIYQQIKEEVIELAKWL